MAQLPHVLQCSPACSPAGEQPSHLLGSDTRPGQLAAGMADLGNQQQGAASAQVVCANGAGSSHALPGSAFAAQPAFPPGSQLAASSGVASDPDDEGSRNWKKLRIFAPERPTPQVSQPLSQTLSSDGMGGILRPQPFSPAMVAAPRSAGPVCGGTCACAGGHNVMMSPLESPSQLLNDLKGWAGWGPGQGGAPQGAPPPMPASGAPAFAGAQLSPAMPQLSPADVPGNTLISAGDNLPLSAGSLTQPPLSHEA